MFQPIKTPQIDNSILSIRVDDLDFSTLVVEKLLNHSVRTVRRLKNLTTEKMRKIGMTDEIYGVMSGKTKVWVRVSLMDMANEGYLERVKRGVYRLVKTIQTKHKITTGKVYDNDERGENPLQN